MIYLDNSATTQAFPSVIQRMGEAMSALYYNPAALYASGLEADRALSQVRESIASALGDRALRVIFTSGGTESNNMALRGPLAALRGKKGQWITTAMEHPSVTRVVEALAAEGHRVDTLSVADQGRVDLGELEALLSPETTVVSVMQVNNETGAMQDLAAIGRLIRQRAPQALFHVDGVQGFLREPVSLTNIGADLYSLSGHKIHGPKGIGALVLSPRAAQRASPLLLGGGQEDGYRSGTPNVPGILGLGQAVTEYVAHGEVWRANMHGLKMRLLRGLRDSGLAFAVNGPDPEEAAGHILNLSLEGVRGEVLLHALEGEGVLVSTGSACSSRSRKVNGVLLSQGVSPSRSEQAIRISLGALNTAQEIDTAVEIIRAQATRLARFRRK